MRIAAIVAALCLCTAANAAPTITISEDGKTSEHACEPLTEVVVSGNDNTVTLTGVCSRLSVNGNRNHITVTISGRIEAAGNENVVQWKKAKVRAEPKVTDLGKGNKIERVSP